MVEAIVSVALSQVNMSSGAALHGQIGSIITALCNAAAAQITKVVEDGMVVLRLEVTQREHEIRRLRSSMEVLHGELRAAHRTADSLRGAQQHHQQHPRGGYPWTPVGVQTTALMAC